MSQSPLWAPWRTEYVRGRREEGCFLCRVRDEDQDRANLVLTRGEGVFVLLNRYPYTSGHCMVVPNRHVSAPENLDAAEAGEVWALMVAAKRALGGALCPDGYNVGFNLGKAAGAGVESHLHLHIVPRWTGDTNFMPVLDGTRVISQHLLETYDLLAPRMSEVSGVGAGPSAAGSE